MAALSEKEISDLKAVFKTFDDNGDGFVDRGELTGILKNLNMYENELQVSNLIKEVDKNNNGTVEFDEFLDVVLNIKNGKGSASKGFALVYSKQKDLVSYKGHTGTHSFSEEEMSAFAEHFNNYLSEDPDVKHLLPINPSGLDLCKKVRDGILLSKFINLAAKDTIDPRALNTPKNGKALDMFKISENQTLCLTSAKGIGCKLTNIGNQDLIDGEKNPHIVLGLVWQLVKIHLLNSINLKNFPELVRLLEDGETLQDLLKLPADELLLRWMNYHLKNSGSPKRVKNWGGDVKDSEAYTIVLNQIDPNVCDKAALTKSDPLARASDVIRNAKNLGVKNFIKPNDIASGNQKLNLIFAASIFNTNPGLTPLTQEEIKKCGLMDDDGGDSREERVFRLWINSLGLDNGELYINNLFGDCCDGLVLLKVLDHISPGIVAWKSVEKNPTNKFKKVANCNYVVLLCKSLKFSTVNIGGGDLVAGNQKLILGLTWQMMRFHVLKFISEVQQKKFGNKEVTDQDLIEWANQKVRSVGKTHTIDSFKDKSLSTGLFFIDLLYSIDGKVIDETLLTEGTNAEDAILNARYAISIARKCGLRGNAKCVK